MVAVIGNDLLSGEKIRWALVSAVVVAMGDRHVLGSRTWERSTFELDWVD